MSILREYSSLFFDKTKVTIFLESLNRYYKDYKIKDLIKYKDYLVKYIEKSI